MKKLLDRNLKVFLLYALVVFLGSVPVYFFIVDLIWRTELHEHNMIVALRAKRNFELLTGDTGSLNNSIRAWNQIQPDASIIPVPAVNKDSVYTVYKHNSFTGHVELDRFHGLVTYFTVAGQPYRMTIETNIEESYETIGAITAVTAIFFLVLLGGFLLLNKRLSRKLWAPFHKTIDRLEAYDLKSQEHIPLPVTNIVEFEALHRGIRKLIDGNLTAYLEQKEFTENASHELQTPLAIVQSKLDLILQTQELTEEQSGIIENASKSLSRVSRINRNLVLLAKIDNRQFTDQEPMDMAQLLRELKADMEDFIEEKELRFDITASQPCEVVGNRALAEILLTNLLMNAIRHTSTRGNVLIWLEGYTLNITNTGATSLPEDKLFNRFSSAAVHTTGTGLGLAIVKEICQLYGWSAGYRFAEGWHHFSVRFTGNTKE
ncbi:sensor histidine kinase [Chitinophaga cymbidii]|uniref:histidine kinase n=1 Tax=Chitinophaga cymbidii TaxID=1096750 RepID=A0A512RPY3_9BACT|nr:HAMP domain-containing sensor histidine kinase [Chitinophaga cymbidii]GEP97747.1 two-component sensor histidine kinase [Chitinophaga cymbidii]